MMKCTGERCPIKQDCDRYPPEIEERPGYLMGTWATCFASVPYSKKAKGCPEFRPKELDRVSGAKNWAK